MDDKLKILTEKKEELDKQEPLTADALQNI